MTTLNKTLLTQVQAMVDAGVQEGEMIKIFNIFCDHIVSHCPGNITLDMWKELLAELGRAFPHIDASAVVDVLLNRGHYIALTEDQPDEIIRWWNTYVCRFHMVASK